MKTVDWHHCYTKQAKDYIVPEAVVHPAKMAPGLCERIFKFLEEKGYIKRGDLILDPFGGIGMTGIVGAARGYQVVLIELEKKFVDLAQKNFDRLGSNVKYAPKIIQGDSREIQKVLREADGIVTSPPYLYTNFIGGHGSKGQPARNVRDKFYGEANGQIGKEKGETYWQAMLKVYTECHAVLKSGGVMAVVCKDFVRKKSRVPLCDDTVKLLEHIGFKTLYRVRAWLVEDQGTPDMFHGETRKKSRKSFFRRLAEKKGSPAIDHEEVLIVQKLR